MMYSLAKYTRQLNRDYIKFRTNKTNAHNFSAHDAMSICQSQSSVATCISAFWDSVYHKSINRFFNTMQPCRDKTELSNQSVNKTRNK